MKHLKKIMMYFLFTLTAQKLEETKGQQEQLTKEMEEKQKALDEINRKYEKLKVLLEQRGYARTRRQNVETTFRNDK